MTVLVYRRCTHCVMDTTDPEIRFDGDGRCNHCSGQTEKLARLKGERRYGREHLPDLLRRMKAAGTGRRYDAVLGISGGADSAFLALALHELGLRLLLVHVDNGWDTADAAFNIRMVVEATGFDYRSFVLDWEEFRDIQLAFLRASVVEAETPTDLAIAGAIHRIAAEHGITVIASASNEASEGILPRFWHYNSKDMRYFRHINRVHGRGRLRHYPRFGFATELYHKLVRGVRILYPLNFMDYDRDAAITLLKERIGWRDYGGKHHESHYTRFVQSYLLPTKFDLDYRKATLSSLICIGQVSRDQAVAILERPPFLPEEVPSQKRYIALKLALLPEELDAIIAQPAAYFHDFPNHDRLLSTAYGLYRIVARAAA
jgi:N-acetyl sugar amidotransferase